MRLSKSFPARRLHLGFALLLSLTVASGCVTTTEPIGQPLEKPPDPPLNGTWRLGDGEVVHLHYAGDGKLRLAKPYWDDGRFKIEERTWLLTRNDDALYVHWRGASPEASENESYLFFRAIRPDPETLVLFMPKPQAFDEAVRSGALAGKRKRFIEVTAKPDQDPATQPGTMQSETGFFNVALQASSRELSKFTEEGTLDEQFNLDRGLVLRMLEPATEHVKQQSDTAERDSP
jgi:hypothetical protein